MLILIFSALISFTLAFCVVGSVKVSFFVAAMILTCLLNVYLGAILFLITTLYDKALIKRESRVNKLLIENQESLLSKLEKEVRFKREMSARVLHMTKRIKERKKSDD